MKKDTWRCAFISSAKKFRVKRLSDNVSSSYPSQFIYPSPEHLARTLAWQFWALMILVAAHIFVVGYTDPLDSTQLSIQVIVIG